MISEFLFYSFFLIIMNNQTISTIALVLSILALVLWFTWKYWGTQVAQAPSNIVAPQPAPTPAPQPTTAPQPAPANVKVAQADYDKFLEWAYVQWNKDAKVTVIEFSDVQCPFCQRHTNNGTLDQVVEKYWDDVNVMFAHFPLGFHENAQKAWEAIECAGKVWGEEWFFAMKKAYFAKWWDSNMDLARESAEEAWLDADAVMDCVEWGEFAQKVKDQMAFGQGLWVTGTPWNIVINNETLETTKVSWAVPATAFDASISSYLQ